MVDIPNCNLVYKICLVSPLQIGDRNMFSMELEVNILFEDCKKVVQSSRSDILTDSSNPPHKSTLYVYVRVKWR